MEVEFCIRVVADSVVASVFDEWNQTFTCRRQYLKQEIYVLKILVSLENKGKKIKYSESTASGMIF